MIFHKFIPILLLFFIFETNASFAYTHFNFHEKINCRAHKYWYYQIYYYELDSWEYEWFDDYLGTTGKHYFSGENREEYTMSNTQLGDSIFPEDDDDRGYYVVTADVTHNCTNSGEITRKFPVGKFAVESQTYDVRYNWELNELHETWGHFFIK